jgi:type I restriction enzyme S subunit
MELRKGYKHSELGVIPEDWDLKRLLDISDFSNGKAHEQSIDEAGDFVVVNSKFISTEGKIFKNSNQAISPLVKGDIALVMSDIPNGKALAKCYLIEADNKYTLNQRICSINTKVCDNLFLFYVLNRNKYFLSFDSGAGQTNLRRNEVLDCPLAIPSTIVEQTSIATALSDIDELISQVEKLIDKKKAIKQGVMQELLKPKEDWVTKKLGEVAEIYQPQTISQDVFIEDGYLVYGANGIIGKYHLFNHESWQTTITCRGSTCGTVNKTVDKSWITGNAMVMNVDNNKQIDKSFFYYILTKQNFSQCITGSGQPQIVRNPLFEFKVCLPKKFEEQTQIATILSNMDAEITALEIKISKFKLQKQGMMQALLTGKIRLI